MAFELGLHHLEAIGVAPATAVRFLEPIRAAAERFEVDKSGIRLACWLGQCQVESQNFTRLEERLTYTTPQRLVEVFRYNRPNAIKTVEQAKAYVRNKVGLANYVYAGKGGNGDVQSGHGWLYRGRGLIQTTLRGNYAEAEKATGRPYLEQPDLLLIPEDATLAAAAYCAQRGLNELADMIPTVGVKPIVDRITFKVNTAGLEADQRLRRTQRALAIFQTT